MNAAENQGRELELAKPKLRASSSSVLRSEVTQGPHRPSHG